MNMFMIYLWSISFCFTSILIQVIAESPVLEMNFEVMAAGHSGLLIFWDQTEVKEAESMFLIFKCQTLDNNKNYRNIPSTNIGVIIGQYQIHSLNESTLYQINVAQYLWSNNTPIKKTLDSNQWININGISNGYQIIKYIFVEKIYEFVVVSVNGNFETESDPQEVFYGMTSSPIQSVKEVALTNTSLLISWKPPRQSLQPVTTYTISYNTLNKSMNAVHFYKQNWLKAFTKWTIAMNQNSYEQIIISDLKPRVQYTFFIIPVMNYTNGCSYGFKYTLHPQTNNVHLPLAKPELRFGTFAYRSNDCLFRIQWLPCGQKFDYKNMKPGSTFQLTVENESTGMTIYNGIKKEVDNYEIYATKNQTFKVTLAAVDGHINLTAVVERIEISDCP